MSLQTRLVALVNAIGTDIKDLRTEVRTGKVVFVNTEAEADALPANTLAIVLEPL